MSGCFLDPAWTQILPPLLSSCATLLRSLDLSVPMFLIFKVGEMITPASWYYYET